MLPTKNANSNEHFNARSIRSHHSEAIGRHCSESRPAVNGKNVSEPLNEIKVFSSEIKNMKNAGREEISF